MGFDFRFLRLFLTVVILYSVLSTYVNATSVTSITPTTGPPGTSVSLSGYIDTPMGSWRAFFAGAVVASGTAGPNAEVQAGFTIPDGTAPGTYLVPLQDMQTNTQSSAQFTVTPSQLQIVYVTQYGTHYVTNTVFVNYTVTETSMSVQTKVERSLATVTTVSHETVVIGNVLIPGLPRVLEEYWPLLTLLGLAFGFSLGYLSRKGRLTYVGSSGPSRDFTHFLAPTDPTQAPVPMNCDEVKARLDLLRDEIGKLQDYLDAKLDLARSWQKFVDSASAELESIYKDLADWKKKYDEFLKVHPIEESSSWADEPGTGGKTLLGDFNEIRGNIWHDEGLISKFEPGLIYGKDQLDIANKAVEDIRNKLDPKQKKFDNMNTRYFEECIKGKTEGPTIR